METFMNLLAILVLILWAVWVIKQLGKLKTIEKVVIKNTCNDWLPPAEYPTEKQFTKVICTVRNDDGKSVVTDAIFDRKDKRFKGLKPDFHGKVIAWMPFPEPFENCLK